MRYRYFVWTAIGLLVLTGIVLSVRDYKNWRQVELEKYGQGSESELGLVPAMELSLPYVSSAGGFRIKYPLDWKVIENPVYIPKNNKSVVLPTEKLAELLRFEEPSGTTKIIVSVQSVQSGDLTTWAAKFASGITRDREYITVSDIPFTVLTWDGPTETTQRAISVINNKLIVIEATCATSAWKNWAKTFGIVYQSWTKI